LTLSLYSDQFFDVPWVGTIEEHWRVDWTKRSSLVGGGTYQVRESEWDKFKTFLQLAEKAIFELRWSPRFSAAADRYLQATFARGNNFFPQLELNTYSWDEFTGEEVLSRTAEPDERSLKTEVLLNYVFALEALANEPSDKNNSDQKNQGILPRGSLL